MKTKSLSFILAFLLFTTFTVPVLACCPPPQPPCYKCEDGVWVWNCSAGQTCCGGVCCSHACCSGNCCSAGQYCCGGACCSNRCCLGTCCSAGQTACCGDICYNSATQKCCTDANSLYICDINQTCCQGNCCQYGCCEEEIKDEMWCISRGCGCNPVIGGCSGKREREAGPTQVYYSSGTGSKCKIPQGELLCYRWRDCQQAGYHLYETCITIDPYFPQGYCTVWAWPYCQDCEGTGVWRDEFTTSGRRCVAP